MPPDFVQAHTRGPFSFDTVVDTYLLVDNSLVQMSRACGFRRGSCGSIRIALVEITWATLEPC
jgi:hypothetical protein